VVGGEGRGGVTRCPGGDVCSAVGWATAPGVTVLYAVNAVNAAKPLGWLQQFPACGSEEVAIVRLVAQHHMMCWCNAATLMGKVKEAKQAGGSG